MACLASAAVAPCGSWPKTVVLTSSTLASVPSLSVASRYSSLKQSLFMGGDEVLLFAATPPFPQSPSSLRVLHIVGSQPSQLNPGSESGFDVLRSKKVGWDGIKYLAVAEGVCIMVAAVSYTTSAIQRKQVSVVASASESKFFPKLGDLSTFCLPALMAALAINAISRAMQRQFPTKSTRRVWEEKSIKDFTLDQRVGKLEEDVQGVAAMARMLSRHLEKLGVRFRVTRRTLQDSLQEAAVIARKTSEVVTALSIQEDMLEKELRETQRILVAMQAQQAKQLELLVAGMTKTLTLQKASEERILKKLPRRPVGASSMSIDGKSNILISEKKGRACEERESGYLMRILGGFRKGLADRKRTRVNLSGNNPAATKVGEVQLTLEHPVDKHSGQAERNKTVYKRPEKEDFWATDTAKVASTAVTAVEHEVSDRLADTETGQPIHARSTYSNHARSSSTSFQKLDSFFSSRKAVNASQSQTDLWTKDAHNPRFSSVHSQSGEEGNTGAHRDYTM